MDAPTTPRIRQCNAIADVDPGQWNALVDADYPFLRHEFLHALETTGCVSADNGWQPAHVLVENGTALIAAAPVYRKRHSYGEFVFDFAWARAYQQFGLAYYPKLVCAVPFTPVVGPRLLAVDAKARAALAAALEILPSDTGASSLHLLFACQQDRRTLAQCGALLRRDCHYLWHNRGYTDFDEFLAALPSRRRKEIRRERRRIAEQGIQVRVLAPAQISPELMRTLYAFYARTYLVRGQYPYLSPDFFQTLHAAMPRQLRWFVAWAGDEPVAAAFMLVGEDSLYGRHWGCAQDRHSLHFETCYYAGIEYCIEHGLRRFDAGAQGEHKLRRGFEPVATWSAHVLTEPRLRAAVAAFVQREGELVADYHAQQRRACAFPNIEQPTS
ncbi:MAG: GNAT family N-acetyltransferase [Salinisphaera sp.]|nr:GNAT family N-acetyltransferase [Salinisphaera sp.]